MDLVESSNLVAKLKSWHDTQQQKEEETIKIQQTKWFYVCDWKIKKNFYTATKRIKTFIAALAAR